MKKSSKKKENNSNLTNDKVFRVLLILLVVLTITIIVIKFINRNNLDTNSTLVKELHNYLNSDDLGNCDGLFTYSEGKVEYSDIDPETRMCIAYQKANMPEKLDTESYKADKKKDICTVDDMVFRVDELNEECTATKIDRSVIDDSYKKLFGKEVEENESFKIDNYNICYLKDDHYYCGLSETYTYTLGNEATIYRVIDKAVEKGSELVIYDYFTKVNNDTCFKAYTTVTVNENCTEEYKALKDKEDVNYKFMSKYATGYKHTFKKAENDTYYWVSSEPVN